MDGLSLDDSSNKGYSQCPDEARKHGHHHHHHRIGGFIHGFGQKHAHGHYHGHRHGLGHAYGSEHGHRYGHMHGHGHGHGHGPWWSMGNPKGEEFETLKADEQKEPTATNGFHGHHSCDKCHEGRGHRGGRLGSPERSDVLVVNEETATGGHKDSAADGLPAGGAVDGQDVAMITGIHGGRGFHGHHRRHSGKHKGFFGGDERHGMHGKFHKGHKGRHRAPLDVIVSQDAYTILVDAPGVRIENVTVTREDAVLAIRIVRDLPPEGGVTEGERVLIRERTFGETLRQVALPRDAVMEVATSEASAGVLRVTVPRHAEIDEPAEGKIPADKGSGRMGMDMVD